MVRLSATSGLIHRKAHRRGHPLDVHQRLFEGACDPVGKSPALSSRSHP